MQKIVHVHCPKCNNSTQLYRYGKTPDGYQKYLCRKCFHQFAPGKAAVRTNQSPSSPQAGKYPPCPRCGKESFLHHDRKFYFNYRCGDKKCNHSFFVPKPVAVPSASVSALVGKTNFKRMRFPIHLIVSAVAMFYLGTSSFRKIALIMRVCYGIRVSHQTVANWCRKFAPLWNNMSLELIAGLDFNSDEWHADETVVKINGVKHWLWLIVDSETRFILGFHLSPRRDSPQAFSLLQSVKHLGKPQTVVSDRLASYKVPVKSVLGVRHHRVPSFADAIPNNLIECFNKQFKAWYKTKNGFCSFESANNMIATFLFFFNFVRPHMALDGLTPAQVADLSLSKRQKRKFLNLVA